MKNKLIEMLSKKNQFPNTNEGKVKYLYELIECARNVGFKRYIKNTNIDNITGQSCYDRSRVYRTKSFFGFKYVSFVNCELHYQEALIKLCQYNVELAKDYGLIDSDLAYEFNLQMSRLKSSLREAKHKEEEKAYLSW